MAICVKFCFVPLCLELRSMAFEAWLLLNVQCMLLANFKPKRSCDIARFTTARLSCNNIISTDAWCAASWLAAMILRLWFQCNYSSRDWFKSVLQSLNAAINTHVGRRLFCACALRPDAWSGIDTNGQQFVNTSAFTSARVASITPCQSNCVPKLLGTIDCAEVRPVLR